MQSAIRTAAALAALALPLPAQAGTWAEVDAILQERCVFCHSGDAAPLGLVLESHAGLMAGSENGPVVVTGAPGDSALIARLTGRAEPQMPLDGPPFLEPGQIAAVEAWIAAGAPGPSEAEAGAEAAAPPAPADPMADGRVTYDEVAAIFGRHCIECHSGNSKMEAPPEGLRLDSYDSVLAGGDRLAVLPGNAQASEVIRRVEGLAEPRMPFDGPPWLTEAEIALLRAWIDGGALSAEGAPAPVPVGARLRIRGVMTGPSEIDGAAFEITGATRIDDRPGIGGAAELRGRIGPDGRILAERLRDR
jgi:mono/diheme cytochrome c family protein